MGKVRQPKPTKGERFGVRSQPVVSDDDQRPHFSLVHMVRGSHCLESCDGDGRAAFASALWRRSQLTWAELRQAGRGGLGYERIPRDSIRVPVPSSVTPEVDSFLSFGSGGPMRLIGYRTGVLFHVIWFDTSFEVYTH